MQLVPLIVGIPQALALGRRLDGRQGDVLGLGFFILERRIERFALHAVARCKIDTQDVGDGGGELLGIEHAVVGGLPQRGDALAEGDEPGLLGAPDAFPMAPEGGAVATTVVAGQEIGGLALVERVGLAVFHDAADVEVRPVDGIQIMVVSATVRELVRVTKTHVEHLRMLLLQGFEGHAEGDAVQTFAVPEAAVRNAGVHILHHPGGRGVRVGGFMAFMAKRMLSQEEYIITLPL